jgi:hypothetical protein
MHWAGEVMAAAGMKTQGPPSVYRKLSLGDQF